MDSSNIDFNTNSILLNTLINKLNYASPSEIQRKVINADLPSNNRNIFIIKSEAGSGKTFAYLLLLLKNIDITLNAIQCVIILPTRELALQTEDYMKLLVEKGLRYQVLIGGKANMPGKVKKEKIDIKNVPHVIIGTVGKITQVMVRKGRLWNDNHTFYNSLNNLVVDEADKMQSQNDNSSYEHLIRILYEKIRSNNKEISRVILCSASFNDNDITFYNKLFNQSNTDNYVMIEESINEEEQNIKEYYTIIKEEKRLTYYEQKYKILFSILSKFQSKYKQCLIFYNQKGKGEELSSDLRSYDFSTAFIHGDLSQDQRQLIYEQIKKLNIKIIISTDLLSRGIDLTAVNLVINFDMPYSEKDYYHRVGRTGRFFSNGIALSLIQQNEEEKFKNMIESEVAKRIESIDEEFYKEIDAVFDEIEGKCRLSNEEKEKVKLLEIDNEKKSHIEENINMLNQKRRREMYESQSLIKEWEPVDTIQEEDSKECQCVKDNNHKFCLYCDFFKIFDV